MLQLNTTVSQSRLEHIPSNWQLNGAEKIISMNEFVIKYNSVLASVQALELIWLCEVRGQVLEIHIS